MVKEIAVTRYASNMMTFCKAKEDAYAYFKIETADVQGLYEISKNTIRTSDY